MFRDIKLVLSKRLHAKNEKTIRDLAKKWPDDKYLQLMLKSISQPYVNGVKMPGFPKADIQRQFVGSTNERALREGFGFYQRVKTMCRSWGTPISEETRILDFGCGWGRISRFFFKDVAKENFFGVDVDPEMISFCASAMNYGTYATVQPEPPMAFESSSLDVIFAYSVFSHLAEPVALKWIEEFARVLRPNGILLATTEGSAFLDFCQSLQQHEGPLEFGWHQGLAKSFIPIEKFKEEHAAGKFLYAPTGGGGPRDKSFYGEAVIPKKYVEQYYAPFLVLREFIDDPRQHSQALFVMQKHP